MKEQTFVLIIKTWSSECLSSISACISWTLVSNQCRIWEAGRGTGSSVWIPGTPALCSQPGCSPPAPDVAELGLWTKGRKLPPDLAPWHSYSLPTRTHTPLSCLYTKTLFTSQIIKKKVNMGISFYIIQKTIPNEKKKGTSLWSGACFTLFDGQDDLNWSMTYSLLRNWGEKQLCEGTWVDDDSPCAPETSNAACNESRASHSLHPALLS